MRRRLRSTVGLSAVALLVLGIAGGSVTSASAVPAPPPAATAADDPWVPVGAGVVARSIAYGPAAAKQSVDVFAPADDPTAPRPTVLLVHGGGWQIGDGSDWASEAVELVRERGWTAATVNYRLTGDAPWPAQLDDVEAAHRALLARAAELGVDPDRVGALGDSAGGHLAALLGRPGDDGRPPLAALVTWSGINDLAGVTEQRAAGGCPPGAEGCTPSGLAVKVADDLLGCLPAACPDVYRSGSPAADVDDRRPPTLAFSSTGEQVDPRQAWVMDAALARNGVESRVRILPGRLHARGYQSRAWADSLAFLAAHLAPEDSPAFPVPQVSAELEVPEQVQVGQRVELEGVVRPAQPGSSVAVQVLGGNGVWRTVRTPGLEVGWRGSAFTAEWTPATPGTTTWRAVWRGSGAVAESAPRTVVVR